jgi:GNAT superfamily N-acetyltransferase
MQPKPPARLATPEDLVPLSALIEAAYRGPESLEGWTSEAGLIDGQRLTHEQLLHAITREDGVMLLVELDGDIIGCAGLVRTQEGAEFGKFAVRPSVQSAGFGKAIMASAEDWLARAWGGGVMTMTVIEGREELFAYYQRRGYQRTGKCLPLASVHDAPDWKLGRDLRLEVLAKPVPAAG